MSDLRLSAWFPVFGELYDYCYKVASVVGLMTGEIFGYRNRQALGHAARIAIAMLDGGW